MTLTRMDETYALVGLTTLLGNVADRVGYRGTDDDPYEKAPQTGPGGVFVSPRSRREDDLIRCLEALAATAGDLARRMR